MKRRTIRPQTYLAEPRKNWQPYFSQAELEDWKDFRYSVCRTHTWYDVRESLYQVVGSFKAWLDNSNSHEAIAVEANNNLYYYCRHCRLMGSKLTFKQYSCYSVRTRRKSPVELVKQEEDKEEVPAAVPKLKLISGGMDGFTKDNWLEGLPEGTVFQCIRKGGEFLCLQFHVKRKWKKSCHLFSNFPVQQSGDLIAHYVNFSTKHELLEIQRFGSDWIKENEDAGRQDEKSSVEQSDG